MPSKSDVYICSPRKYLVSHVPCNPSIQFKTCGFASDYDI